MNLNNLTDFILEKMRRELPSSIVYHSAEHTIDVHEAAVRLAELEGLADHETKLLQAAALLHDAGITVSFSDHEDLSVVIAREYLPYFGFGEGDIQAIESMIMATKLPQTASTLCEKILCDADLDYLGRADFFVIAQKLRLEWELSGNKVDLKDWYILQMEFLRNHTYFTESAIRLRDERKLQNLREIEQLCTSNCKNSASIRR
jgi:hypothetical protein